MTTIKAVADRAGVSTATVSRVLSNPAIVQQATRERVQRAVDELNYAPNSAAKSLRMLRTGKIIVTVPDVANPFFSEVLRGAEEAAMQAGYSVLLGDTHDDPATEDRFADMFLRKEADGLIFLGHRMPSALAGLVRRRGGAAPIVNACDFSPDHGVSSAHIDNAAAAADVMALLYSMGHRDIGIIAGAHGSHLTHDRLQGARRASVAADKGDGLLVAHGDYTIESGLRETHRLLGRRPSITAIFCFSDEMAVGALAACRSLGLRCPADISIIGFDDVRYARFLDPPLTTVRQPMSQIGQAAVKLMLSILGGATEREQVVLEHELVVRASTGPAASRA